MEKLLIIAAVYLVVISLVAVIMTVLDKHYAKSGKWRIKEKTLMSVSALGGAVAMLAAMKAIRHKTKHKLFMIGIPCIIAVHIILILAAVFIYLNK